MSARRTRQVNGPKYIKERDENHLKVTIHNVNQIIEREKPGKKVKEK